MKIFISGAAGFIGYNLALSLLQSKKKIIVYGIDNYDDYYSIRIKKLRIKELQKFKNFNFHKIDITKKNLLNYYFKNKKFSYAFHFAAQAGVRYSVINPQKYVDVNIKGFINIMHGLLLTKPKVIFYASSSSVYGDSKQFPLRETNQLNPKNMYALSKQLNEKYAEQFSH